MKVSIKKNMLLGALIVLIAVSLIGCSTTSKSKSNVNEVKIIEQSVEPQLKEKIEEVTEEKVNKEQSADTEILPPKSLISYAKEETVEVIELPIVYPLGIVPIVKSDNSYNTFNLIIVHTSDTYGQVNLEKNSIGFPKLATMIKAGRTLTKNLLVLDAGNSLFSLPIINKVNLSTSQKLQNLIGYDSMAPQSMDFNVGTEKVFNLSTDSKKAAAEFILSANMLDNNNYLPLQPYQLYDFNGFIVCVVGLTSPFTSNLNDQENYSFDSNMVFENSQHAINVARQYADYIVVLGSTGSGDVNDIYSSSFICSNLNGIDLFIDGQYSTVKSGSVVNGATIVNTKAQLKEIGVVDILISNNEVKLVTPLTIEESDVIDPENSILAAKFGISIIEDEQEALKIIEEGKSSYAKTSDSIVAYSSYKLASENKNIKQISLSHLFTDYIVDNTEVDVCMLSSSLFHGSIERGPITLNKIGNAMPTFNRMCYTTMSGQEIFEALELSYGKLPEGSDDFIQTNIKVIYNKYAKVGNRIIRAKINKSYIDKDSQYLVMCDDSLTSDNSRYNMGAINQYLYYPAHYLQKAIIDKFGLLK